MKSFQTQYKYKYNEINIFINADIVYYHTKHDEYDQIVQCQALQIVIIFISFNFIALFVKSFTQGTQNGCKLYVHLEKGSLKH